MGWGAKIFCPGLPSPRGVSEGRCFLQPVVLKAYTLEPHSVGRTPVVGGFPLVQAQHRRSLMDAVGQHAGAGYGLGPMTPPWDSTLVLVRALSP